jgi:hypothetical protein
LRLVGGTALEDEAAVAIAALDEAEPVVDLIIDSGMAERRVDLARTVAIDAVALGPKNFRRRLHGTSPSNRLPPLQ